MPKIGTLLVGVVCVWRSSTSAAHLVALSSTLRIVKHVGFVRLLEAGCEVSQNAHAMPRRVGGQPVVAVLGRTRVHGCGEQQRMTATVHGTARACAAVKHQVGVVGRWFHGRGCNDTSACVVGLQLRYKRATFFRVTDINEMRAQCRVCVSVYRDAQMYWPAGWFTRPA